MRQYWAVFNGKMAGPFEIPELVSQPGFDIKTSVFVSGQDDWKEAIDFPAITRYLKTGELPKDIEVPEDDYRPRINSSNWREAIVPTDVELPDLRLKTAPAPSVSTPQRSLLKRSFWKAHETSLKMIWASRTRHGQKVLLLLLGVTLYGTYEPAVELLPTLLQGIKTDAATIAPKAQHHYLPRPWHRIQKAEPGKAPEAVPAAPAAIDKSKPKVVEVDASPLPDGMVMKTVTTMTQVNGAKIYKTRTYVVEPSKRHRR